MSLVFLTACLTGLAGVIEAPAAAGRETPAPFSSDCVLAVVGERLDPIFPIILGVVLVCLILLRSYFRKKD